MAKSHLYTISAISHPFDSLSVLHKNNINIRAYHCKKWLVLYFSRLVNYSKSSPFYFNLQHYAYDETNNFVGISKNNLLPHITYN
jgi:hypothetical protein